MLDTNSETVLTLAQAARTIPSRSGRGVSASTIWRWCLKGVNGIKLESVVCGGLRVTSEEALQRFFAATTAAADGTTTPIACTSKQRQRQIEAAEKELAAAGI